MLRKRLVKLCNVLFLLLFYAVAVVAYGNMVSLSFLAALLLPALLAGTFYLCSRRKSCSCTREIPYDKIWYAVYLVSFLLMMFLAYRLRVNFTWDWGKVIRSASEYTLTGKLKDKIYFARFPNNQFWYSCMIVLFKVVCRIKPGAGLQDFYMVSIALGCVCVMLTIFFIHRTARLLWGSKKALFTGVISVLFAPMYLYATFAYTDTSGMMVLSVLIYLFVKIRSHRSKRAWEYLYYALMGLFSAVAWNLKMTVFILSIALVITLLLLEKRWKKLVIGLLLIALCFGAGHKTIKLCVGHFISLSEKMYDKWEFPLTHWVMMSLDYGGYVQEDVDFTAGFSTYEERKEANIKEIKRRLKEKGVLGSIKHITYTKLSRTWKDPLFAGSLYLSREPVYPDSVFQRFVIYSGDCYWVLTLYASLFYGLMLMGILLSGLTGFCRRAERQPLLFVRIAMIGVIIFLSIWECNSRYIVVYFPALILLTGDGLCSCRVMERMIWGKIRSALKKRV